jgi:hypothetical protein
MYYINNNICFKEFNSSISLSDEYFIEVISKIMSFKDIPLCVKPIDIYTSREYILGYSMPIIKGVTLDNLDDDISIDDLIKCFRLAKKTLYSISKYNLYLKDMHSGNIIYDGNFRFIDLEDSVITNDIYQGYIENIRLLYNTLNYILSYGSTYGLPNSDKFILRVAKECSDMYDEALKEYITYLEDIHNTRLDTIGKVRKLMYECYPDR